MQIPLVVWVSFWLLLLPLGVAYARLGRLDVRKRALVAWICTLLVQSAVARLWALWSHPANNLIVGYLFMPLQGTAILWSLSEFQVQPIARTTVRFCIPLYWLWWGVSFRFFEDHSNFSIVGGPVLGLMALAAALFALLSHFQEESALPLLHSDWLWCLAGIAIYFGTNTAVTVLQAVVSVSQDHGMLVRASILKAWVDIVAVLCITGGLICPTPPEYSGAYSSRVRYP